MFLKFDNTNIGKRLYLLDHSYSTKLSGNGDWLVAGAIEHKLLTILSAPYVLKYQLWGTERQAEFVTAQCEDMIVIVMNRFSETKPEPMIFDDYHPLLKIPPTKPIPQMQKAYDLIAEFSKEFLHQKKSENLSFPYVKPDKD